MKSLQLDAPHAIVVVGIRGSGKTFFAKKFANTFDAPYVNRADIVPFAANEASGDIIVTRLINELVKTKKSLLVEVQADTRQRRVELVRMFKNEGYKTLFVWVQVDADSARARFIKESGATESDHKRSVAKFTPLRETEPYLVISGKHTYATQAKIVLKKLAVSRTESSRQVANIDRPPVRGQIIVR